jgi:hypothetical protein
VDCSTQTCDYIVIYQVIVYLDCARRTTHLDAHKDERLKIVLAKQGEYLWRRHRKERLFESAEVERTE